MGHELWLLRMLCVVHGPLSLGVHVESLENKKLCFCTASLTLNSRLAKACHTKTKLFIPLRFNMAPCDKGLLCSAVMDITLWTLHCESRATG